MVRVSQRSLHLLVFHLHTAHGVEAIAEDGCSTRLRDEGSTVDALDNSKDMIALILPRQHHQHLCWLLCVPSCGIKHGDSAVIDIDGTGYFLILFGDNEELHRLSFAVVHIVERQVRHEERSVTIDKLHKIGSRQEHG